MKIIYIYNWLDASFDFLVAMPVRITILQSVTTSSLVSIYRHFLRTHYLYLLL